MASSMVFYVVAEARADAVIATRLADRVALYHVDWLDGVMDSMRTWKGFEAGATYTKWTRIKHLAAEYRHGLRTHGRGQGAAKQEAEKAIRLCSLLAEPEPPDCILLVRDSDNDEGRRDAFRSVAGQRNPVVLVAMPHPKREAWVLAGFIPVNAAEASALGSLRAELGFDPTERAQELTAAPEGAKRNAKRVLRQLVEGDSQREAVCWESADLATLKARGQETGLAEFLDSLGVHLVPLLQKA